MHKKGKKAAIERVEKPRCKTEFKLIGNQSILRNFLTLPLVSSKLIKFRKHLNFKKSTVVQVYGIVCFPAAALGAPWPAKPVSPGPKR